MANHNLPTLTSTYANFVTELDARMDDISIGFDPAFTTVGNANYNASLSAPTNIITGTIRWTSNNSKWQKWSGSTWADLSSSYAISISGNAATATKLANIRTINGVNFDGTQNITIGISNSLTINNGGAGVVSGSTFNGSAAVTISYNTVGAPSTTGTNASGTWAIGITGNAASVTNGVYTSGDQTIGGIKTFSSQTKFSSGTAAAPGIAFSADSNTGLYWTADGFTNFTNNGVFSGSIDASGNLLMVGNITAYGSATAPSDIRIKTNILKISNALDKILSLNGITYDRTDITSARQTGLIAQEVEKVLPEAVVVLNNEQKTLTVAYGNMMGLLVEAIKELKLELDALKLTNK